MWRKDARVRVAPIIFDAPFTDEHNKRCYPLTSAAVLFDQSTYSRSICTRLLDAVSLFGKATHKQPFLVLKSDFAFAAAELRFDSEYAARSDENVVHIEILADDVVNGFVAVSPQLFECVGDVLLTAFTSIQPPRHWNEA